MRVERHSCGRDGVWECSRRLHDVSGLIENRNVGRTAHWCERAREVEMAVVRVKR